MTEHHEAIVIPGYISTKQAAQILGVSNHRLYQYVKAGRLPVVRIGKAFMIRVEDVERFKPNPSGRMRRKAPSWRAYRSRGRLLVTEMQVQVRANQQARLVEQLKALQEADRHTFPGTIARYIIKGDEQLSSLHLLFIWKDTEMPEESTQHDDLAAFQAEFADVLDWETLQSRTNEAIIHT